MKTFLMLLLLVQVAMSAEFTPANSLSAFTTAYNSASDGDRITIQAGSNDWASGVIIEKRITIAGSGSNYNGTVIQFSSTAGSGELPIFDLQANGITISNMQIRGLDLTTGWLVIVRSNACRIRDVHFTRGKSPIISYCDYGLVYNCTFLDCKHMFRSFANNATARHARYPDPVHGSSGHEIYGNTNYFVGENCIFNNTSTTDPDYPIVVSSQLGGMWIVRHCEIRNAGNFGPAFDAHSSIGAGADGVIAFQVYSNWCSCTGSDRDKYVDHRGGRGIVYSNNLAQGTWGNRPLFLRVDDDNEDSYFDPGPPINGSLYWNNFAGGVLMTNFIEEEFGTLNDRNLIKNYYGYYNGIINLLDDAQYFDPGEVINPGSILAYTVQYPHFLREGEVHDPNKSGFIHHSPTPSLNRVRGFRLLR